MPSSESMPSSGSDVQPSALERGAIITGLIRAGLPQASERFHVIAANGEQALCRLDVSAKVSRPGNTISGPTLMGFADGAFYALVLSRPPYNPMAVTQDLHMHFLAKPALGPLIALVNLVHSGRRTVIMRCDLWSLLSDSEHALDDLNAEQQEWLQTHAATDPPTTRGSALGLRRVAHATSTYALPRS